MAKTINIGSFTNQSQKEAQVKENAIRNKLIINIIFFQFFKRKFIINLIISYFIFFKNMILEAWAGIEPANNGFADRCVTTSPPRRLKNYIIIILKKPSVS